ncbi:hypothetical protein NM208_g218 [Fusarium decemcellulare]|uniref:Uncharacterized protein n=1 Tax=Fusarium decemcellulare TaxID=57161 RepID=A0ACC1T0D4_9HYPO|nr:hypothetical protein NM208_g218 [Fusarium decemcellulare]
MTPPAAIPENVAESEVPSCHGCRRRKLKCSREQPSCATCLRTGEPCIYDAKKSKPGLKIGAVEGLSKRLEVLEQAFHDRSVQESSENAFHSSAIASNVVQLTGAITTLASEIQRLTSSTSSFSSQPVANSTERSEQQQEDIIDCNRHPKRRRVDAHQENSPVANSTEDSTKRSLHLPPGIMEDVVHQYFDRIFYWIPVIHHPRFKEEVKQERGMARLGVILDAMLVATLRFIDLRKYHLSAKKARYIIEEKRNSVILSTMSVPSIENLQALVILAFTTIGAGDSPKAWSIIASLTRTVEYLQLNYEEVERSKRPFVEPLSPIKKAVDWVQEEERRRLFWNVFNLDRFCSITTGWGTSIKDDEIRRRLPANGTYWYAEIPVVCPFLGPGKSSVGKVGSSGTFDRSQYWTKRLTSALDSHTMSRTATTTPLESGNESLSASAMGGFSYAVQATQYLKQVVTGFVYPDVDSGNQQEVTAWLTRFKELDLQLVHWKMFLPKKWRDPNRAPDTSTGPHDLDHSMTLAHVTHNTSMILLHHRIAYPPSQWRRAVPLPSSCSAETCRLAAVKTSNIIETWLRVCPKQIIVPPQIAFCTYISARLLLVHSLYHNEKPIHEFRALVRGLEYMARRWEGLRHDDPQPCYNLAGKYALHLQRLYERCKEDPSMAIAVLDYTESLPSLDDQVTRLAHHYNSNHQQAEAGHNGVGGRFKPTHEGNMETPSSLPMSSRSDTSNAQHTQPLLQHDTLPAPGDSGIRSTNMPTRAPDLSDQGERVQGGPFIMMDQQQIQDVPEDLLAVSQALMDQSFADMDRIITLDDSCFEADVLGSSISSATMHGWNPAQLEFLDMQDDRASTAAQRWVRR